MNISIFPVDVKDVYIEDNTLYVSYIDAGSNLDSRIPITVSLSLPDKKKFDLGPGTITKEVWEVELLKDGKRYATISIFAVPQNRILPIKNSTNYTLIAKGLYNSIKEKLETYKSADVKTILKEIDTLSSKERRRVLSYLLEKVELRG